MNTSANVALVTGAAHRVGRAIALDLARHDWAVAVHYNQSAEDARALVAEILTLGGRAMAVAADLQNDAQIRALVPAVRTELGPVSLLVNNASLFEHDDLASVDRAGWDAHMNANLFAPVLLSQAFVTQLPDGIEGNIINLLDQRVWKLTPFFLSYTVSKTGLWTITQTLAQALAPRIRVNAIGPGPVLPSKRQTQEHFDRQVAAVPLRRAAGIDTICDTVRYLLAAKSVTGQMIALDGGQHLAWQTPDVLGALE